MKKELGCSRTMLCSHGSKNGYWLFP